MALFFLWLPSPSHCCIPSEILWTRQILVSDLCPMELCPDLTPSFQLWRSQLCVLTLIWCPFHPRVTAVACKRHWSFCVKCRWKVTHKHHTPLTQRSLSGLIMPLSRYSVGTYQETSSHATRQRTPGHSRLSSLSHCGLILAQLVELVCASYLHFKKKKKRGGGDELSNILPKW